MKRLMISIMILTSCIVIGQEQEIELKEIPEFWYAAMEFSGSYQKMAENISSFMQEFFSQNLGMPGPVLSIYYNAPQQVAEVDLKWAIGMRVDTKAEVKAPLKKVHFKAQKVARYLHIGSYEKLSQIYQKVSAFIERNGYREQIPTFERYINNPQSVAPAELRTEIWIPIKVK